MKRSIFLLVLMIFLIISCKKESNVQPEIENKINNTFLNSYHGVWDLGPTPITVDYFYDFRGMIIKSSASISYRYNKEGRLEKYQEYDRYLLFFYDINGKIEKLHQQDQYKLDTISLEYNPLGQVIKATSSVNGHFCTFSYNPDGLIKTTTLLDNNGLQEGTLEYEWSDNNLTSIRSGDSRTDFGYDDKINVNKAIHYPDEYVLLCKLFYFVYWTDSFWVPIEDLSANNCISTKTYAKNSLTSEYYTDIIKYNKDGFPKKWFNDYGTLEFFYDTDDEQ